jgi:hypothetical protein
LGVFVLVVGLVVLLLWVGGGGRTNARIYFVGGVTAVLLGWRKSTIDIDLKLVPEANEILRALPDLKERLQVNVELASPDDFIPPLPGWEDRSRLLEYFSRIEDQLYKYPALDAESFRKAVEEVVKRAEI